MSHLIITQAEMDAVLAKPCWFCRHWSLKESSVVAAIVASKPNAAGAVGVKLVGVCESHAEQLQVTMVVLKRREYPPLQ